MVSVRYFVAASRARASESRSERFGTRVEDFFLACARPAGESRRARGRARRVARGDDASGRDSSARGRGGVRGGGIARVRGFGMVVRRLSRAHRRRVHRVRGQGVRVGQVESRVRVRGRRACIFECIFVVLASSRRSVGLKLF